MHLPGKLVVISGYPASGQDTMMNLLLERSRDFERIITHTDRPQRPKEVQGVDYNFVSTQKFKDYIRRDLFFEYVRHGSHYKGTMKSEFSKIKQGKNIIWRIDITRAAIIEETFHSKFKSKEALDLLKRMRKILLKTESRNVALDRYKNRDTNADINEFNKRYKLNERVYTSNKEKFPHVIVNRTGEQENVLKKLIKVIDS